MGLLKQYYKEQDFGEVTGFNFGVGLFGPPLMTAWCYLVDGILVDTGITRMKDKALDVLIHAAPTRILLTHHHEDHSGNACEISNALEIPVFGHNCAVPKLARPNRIYPYQHLLWGKSSPVKVYPYNAVIESESIRLIPIHTPGHSRDHTVYLEPDRGWVFSGDLFLGERIKFFRSDENIYQQINSLKLLLTHDFDTVFCAHRPTLTGGKQCMRLKLDFLENFVGMVKTLQNKGMNQKNIIRALDKKEDRFVKWITNGNVSFAHMVKSALKHVCL